MKSTFKGLLFSVLVFNILYSCTAQRANVWFFGNKAGIDFNSGVPVEVLNSKMDAFEGTASICDTSGNFLMYTNGGPVWSSPEGAIWNSIDSVMPGGNLDSAGGCHSSVQSSLIIPDPGNTNQYYVFSVDCQEHNYAGGFRFHKVDMTLANGLGDVTIKDSLIMNGTTESMVGVRHANGTDYWVVVHGRSTNEFFSFHISPAGISAPVISAIGAGGPQLFGQMTVNCSGDKLAWGKFFGSLLFDFDNSTGVVSNLLDLGYAAFGCAFSPSGRFLYTMTAGSLVDTLYQFDLYAPNIPASVQVIDTSTSPRVGCLALGPDHKIYVARYNAYYLSTINNPDLPGTLCGFTEIGVPLTRQSQYGVPNFVNTFTGECVFTGISLPASANHFFISYDKREKQIHVYFNKYTCALIEVKDLTGRTIISKTFNGNTEIKINAEKLQNGIYLVDISVRNDRVPAQKIFIY